MATSAIKTWFETEVVSWRVFAAITWTIILEFAWVFLFLLLSSLLLDPLHPLTSLSGSIYSLLTPTSWFYDLVLVACLAWWGSLHAHNYNLSPTVLDSWASTLRLATPPSKLASLLTHTLICFLMTWCYVKLHAGPFSHLVQPCRDDGDSLCLHEKHVLIVLTGVMTGPLLWSRYHFGNCNLVSFPPILQNKSSQLRLRLPGLVWSSSVQSLLALRWYYVLYFLFGQMLTLPVAGLLGLPVTGSLASLPSYFNVWLFLECWAVTLLLHLTSAILTTVAAVYLTSPLHLELPSLLDALDTDQSLLLHLSLSSLSGLAASKDPSLCPSVFTLSQPGGHPHNWNTLSSHCLRQIDAMSSKLAELTSPKPASTAAPAPNKEESSAPPAGGMRRLAPVSASAATKGGEVQDLTLVTPPTQILEQAASNALKELKKKPLLSLFFSSPPDSSLRSAFSSCQPVIWSLEILSHLVSASLTEDKYGVVQKQLPVILTSLLNLETSLERTRTTSLTSLRRTTPQFPELQLRRELRSCVKSAIYRISITFQQHILAVPLPKDLHQKIKNYQTFMEA